MKSLSFGTKVIVNSLVLLVLCSGVAYSNTSSNMKSSFDTLVDNIGQKVLLFNDLSVQQDPRLWQGDSQDPKYYW